MIVVDDSVARQDTKGLPALGQLLGQRHKRGIRKVHRQIGILVEQLPDTLQ